MIVHAITPQHCSRDTRAGRPDHARPHTLAVAHAADWTTLMTTTKDVSRLIAAVVSFAAALTLVSCGSDPGEGMTPLESRDAFQKIVQDTSLLVADDGWSEVSPPSWGPCSLGAGEGASVGWTYVHEPLADHVESAKAVADYWSSLGMMVETVTEPDVSVYATGGGAKALAFETAPGSYSISGTSLCAPGDSLELMREEQANQ